ncbi:MAG: energy-coupling factor transporter transmembrane protein EcfT [bacterium]
MIETKEPGSGSAAIDRIDPRARLVSVVVWVGVAAWINHPYALSAAMVLALILAAASGAGFKWVLSRAGYLTIAVLPAWIVLPLMGPDNDTLAAGPIELHASGLQAAALLQAKATTILVAVLGHQGQTPWNRWVWAAHKLGVPPRLLALLTFTLRYLPLLSEEGKRTYTAAIARGFQPKAGTRGYSGLAALAGAGLVRSYYRSERVNRALSARGYQGRFYSLRGERAKAKDVLFLAGSASVLSGIVVLIYWII